MNKFFLGLIASLMLLASAKADSTSVILNGKATNLVVVGPIQLRSVSISSSAITNGLIAFVDSPNAFATNYIGAYTNNVRTITTSNYTYTSPFNVSYTNSYQIISNNVATVAGAMQNRALVGAATSISNAVVTLDFDTTYLGFGLLITNIAGVGAPGNITLNITYDKLR